MVSLLVEFDADDVWFFFLEDSQKRFGKIEDMSGSDEGDHGSSGKSNRI
jgi:hypothetical protein